MNAKCPVCGKKLMLNDTMRIGTFVGCVNCDNVLVVISKNPHKLNVVDKKETLNANSKPESYA